MSQHEDYTDAREYMARLFKHIAHGDEAHRKWLWDKLMEHAVVLVDVLSRADDRGRTNMLGDSR